MPLVVIDTNVISGILNPHDALHASSLHAVHGWEAKGCSFAISVITWSELRVAAIRRGAEAERILAQFRAEAIDQVVAVSEAIADAAARLRARDLTLRVPDALIVATAQTTGADALLSADKKLPKIALDLVELIVPS